MDAIITGPDILRYRASVIHKALTLHLRSRGRLRITRAASPGALLKAASQLTNVTYRRGQYLKALSDLSQILREAPASHVK